MPDHFSPQEVWLARLDYHCSGNVEMGTIGMFRTTIRSWQVMDCEVADRTLMFEVVCKLLSSELPSLVTSKDFDYSLSLYLSPCFIVFIIVKGLGFLMHKVNLLFMCVTSRSKWVQTSENESGMNRDLASAYVLCLCTFVVPNLWRDKRRNLGKQEQKGRLRK